MPGRSKKSGRRLQYWRKHYQLEDKIANVLDELNKELELIQKKRPRVIKERAFKGKILIAILHTNGEKIEDNTIVQRVQFPRSDPLGLYVPSNANHIGFETLIPLYQSKPHQTYLVNLRTPHKCTSSRPESSVGSSRVANPLLPPPEIPNLIAPRVFVPPEIRIDPPQIGPVAPDVFEIQPAEQNNPLRVAQQIIDQILDVEPVARPFLNPRPPGHFAKNCPEITCQICFAKGYTAKECAPINSITPNNPYARIKCQLCGNHGHTARYCPTNPYKRTVPVQFNQQTRNPNVNQFSNQNFNQNAQFPNLSSPNQNQVPQPNPYQLFGQNMGQFQNFNQYSNKFCEYHNTGGHDTNECRAVRRFANNAPNNNNVPFPNTFPNNPPFINNTPFPNNNSFTMPNVNNPPIPIQTNASFPQDAGKSNRPQRSVNFSMEPSPEEDSE
ncbi:hypothetical protein KQX54_008641 [Cotesia glomerata]|uniref:CCHC-type domain-containing protein n=1 Tax=Cotesia glomerata TaxID=32391 RepID=A0AAV7HT30_COTGL|nr:hypothetical protein KQX54_008641 [Cotesia glomerata]